MFDMPDTVPDGIWQETKSKDIPPKNCQISVHSGQMEMIVAMATIDLADLQELVRIIELFLLQNQFDHDQGCGNTMPDLSDQVPFHSGQVENFHLLVLGQVQCIKLIQFCISYFD